MPARKPLTREAVIAAARDLIVEEGMASASLRKLAGRLGVTAPALYAYVDDRQDLLRSVSEDALSQLAARFDAITDGEPLDRLAAQCRAYVDFAVENPDLFVTMFAFPPELEGASPVGVESTVATKVFGRAAQTIDDAIAAGAIPDQDGTVEAALAVWATVHGTAVVLTMGFGFDDAMRAALVDRAVGNVVAGLRARRPAAG